MDLLWLLLVVMIPLAHAIDAPTVTVYPRGGVIAAVGGNASFQCTSTVPHGERGLRIQWLMNESAALVDETTDQGNVVASVIHGIEVLDFINIPSEFNQTRIKCNASLSSGEQFWSATVSLQLQGLLSAVGSLNLTVQDSTISLTWTAPFTLNIRGVNPDITYCVGVSTSSLTLHSECGITGLEYEYPIPPYIGCHDHMVTVTPVNLVGNGIAFSIQSSQILTSPQVKAVQPVTSNIILVYHIIMSDPVCSAEITLTDGDESIALLNSDLTIMLTNVSFTSEKLRLNRKYRIMVNASNINGSSVFSDDISSHDIVETGVHVNPLRIHTQYLLDSQAAGGLFSFLFIDANGVIDFRKSTYLCLEKNTSQSYVLPFTQSPELYVISAYDIEEDGLLYSGEAYPATTSTHVISGPDSTNQLVSEIEDCDVISDEQVVCVQCSFPPNSTSLGFLVVVQRDSISKARTLLVNTTQPGQALGPVTVEVEEGGVYQVTVFAIRGELGIVGSAVEYTTQIEVLADEYSSTQNLIADEDEETGATNSPSTGITIIGVALGAGVSAGLGVLAVATVIVGGMIMAVKCRRVRTSNSEMVVEKRTYDSAKPHNEDVCCSGVKGSLVYEEIGDVKDTFNYTKNLIYGHSSTTTSALTSDPEMTPIITSTLNSGPEVTFTVSQDQKPRVYEVITACT